MLRICRHIFVSGKAVVLHSELFVAKGIIELKDKGLYAEAIIKRQFYCPKVVPGGIIDTYFEYKEVSYVVMIEARTEDNKLFKIFCMKEPDCVMKIMASWMAIDELEGARTRKYFIDISSTKERKQFTYRKPFMLHFRYIHQVDNHNNQTHA